jgi:PAS domain S-box-containing protein
MEALMKNQNRSVLYSVPSQKAETSECKGGNSERLTVQAAEPIDPSSNVDDGFSGKYELLLHQIDDMLADSLEQSNRILTETQIDYLIMHQIFNALSDGIWAVDRDRKIIRVNRKLLALLGKPLEEVIGKKCYEVFSGCQANASSGECTGERIFSGEKLIEQDSAITNADGDKIHFTIVSTPLTDLKGGTIGVVEAFTGFVNRAEGLCISSNKRQAPMVPEEEL